MLRAREVNWGQVPSCVPIGRTFQGRDSTPAGAHQVDFGSFLCCTGDKSKGSVHDATLKIEVIFSLVHETQHEFKQVEFHAACCGVKFWLRNRTFRQNGHGTRGKQRHQHFPVSCSLNFTDTWPLRLLCLKT